MKTFNVQKPNINFKYVIQSTNQLLDHNSFTSQNYPFENIQSPIRKQNQLILDSQAQSFKEMPKTPLKRYSKQKCGSSGKKRQSTHTQEKTFKFEYDHQLIFFEQKEQEKVIPKQISVRKTKNNVIKHPPPTTPNIFKQEEQQDLRNSFSRKGLALISSLILEVLEGQYNQNKKFTCGEISTKVLAEFCKKQSEKQIESSIQQKQRKTIKRRVYDSINVLIALGKIKKDHKWLFVQSIDKKNGEEIVLAKKQTIFKLKKDLTKKVQYQKLKILKQRNEDLIESRQMVAQATVSTHYRDPHTCYRFPLIFVYTEPKCKLRIELKQSQSLDQKSEAKQEIIVQANPLYLLSDLSSLEYLQLDEQKLKIQGSNRGNFSLK